MGKKGGNKRKREENVPTKDVTKEIPPTRSSDEPIRKKVKWTNKERVLVFASRGVSFRDRHLMKDILTLMPHSKPDTKMDKKDKLFMINEICEMKNCTKCLFFEAKKKKDLYMWASNTPRGPSVKFLLENIHTMRELKMTGNCLKGSRPLLSFSKDFDSEPHWQVIKEVFIQIFNTPQYHPKSQPFVDHVFTFGIADNRIWFRNYQIMEEDGSLAEIGPRFVMNPIKVFEGSFGGTTLYHNPEYKSPNTLRREAKMSKKKAYKYMAKAASKKSLSERRTQSDETYPVDATDDVFQTH